MNPVEINEPVVTSAQARVLSTLRDAGRALTLADLHDATGLHPNTLRGHLDALVAAGSASRIATRSGGRGRPRWGYLAREPEYAALAVALASGLDAGDGRALDPAAVRGGRAWGERLRAQLGPVEDGRERVLLALAHTGFAPTTDGDRVVLNACPLLDAARSHPAVVCAVHLGLVEGVLGQEGAGLRPRPETLGCVVSLP
ncbi:transcriptional regulator [Nocardioides flavus (ex Wang et al. 2016)]|uniref:Transcriptional regulator n=1 Tax=Nocardioides flavus (ex Wang et al. 2016) TaxID=2058780 RepID=A0ABQ3HU30_9ACTN|nr:helix-turn-helix domain-containing protein [Nocardioides flavus (ex Wang et al. 2016)]GHE19350.1 transcriptional regulator [Nocardioides flavus (ex Wang et al. 2016)]